jgi:hypothetical protein
MAMRRSGRTSAQAEVRSKRLTPSPAGTPGMRFIHRVFPLSHFLISLLFVGGALALIVFAVLALWQGIQPGGGSAPHPRIDAVLESIALLTVAVAALELGQTILEEEVQREAQMSAPTRVRRFLSRFMVVLVVALSIETLVLVFRLGREAPEQLPFVGLVGLMTAALLAAWGVFVRLNRSAEELEPEAMQEALDEDHKVTPEARTLDDRGARERLQRTGPKV